MKLNITNLTKIAAALMLTVFAAHAQIMTVPITVPNASFESPASPSSTSTNFTIVPGWIFNVKAGSQFGTAPIASTYSSPGTSSGSNFAIINNDWPDVTDTLTSAASLGTIAPLTTYTLTVAIGNENRSDSAIYSSPGNVSLNLLADGVAFATREVPNGSVANGTFQDFSLSFTTPSTAPIIGEDLTIQFATLPEEGNAYQPGFDNVRLTAQSVAVAPEPHTWALFASGLLSLCWFVRWQRTQGAV